MQDSAKTRVRRLPAIPMAAALMGATALVAISAPAFAADELPACDNCANEITIVSWGGAY